MEALILTDTTRCVMCMSCVRACKVHANKLKDDYIEAVPDLCIACGSCIEACPEGARYYIQQIETLEEWLSGEDEIAAILAPSYLSHYEDPYVFIGKLRKIGISKVYEVAIGAELSSIIIAEEIKEGRRVISSPCSAVINYVKRWLPDLIPYLSRAVSPMIATALLLKKRYPDIKVVFIGPCVAKKSEVLDGDVKGYVDLVLTFEEVDELIKGIDGDNLRQLPDEIDPLFGVSYPVAGGLARTVGFYLEESTDFILDFDTVLVEGEEKVISFLNRYLEKIRQGEEETLPKLAELLYCSGGCLGGPGIRDDLEFFEKRRALIQNLRRRMGELLESESIFKRRMRALAGDLNLIRNFSPEPVKYVKPSEEEINKVLEMIGMLEKPLNCGACGFKTCRERAIAVVNGLLPWDMCIQYQMRLLERKHERLMNEIRIKTIEKTKQVIDKQMKVAQEIASLLGETVAETKASLLKLLQIVEQEDRIDV